MYWLNFKLCLKSKVILYPLTWILRVGKFWLVDFLFLHLDLSPMTSGIKIGKREKERKVLVRHTVIRCWFVLSTKKMFKIHRCPCRLLEHFPPLHYAYLGHPDLVCNKHVLLITAQSKYTPQRQLSACRHNKTLPHTMLSALLYFFFLHFLSSFFSSFSSSMYIAPTEIYCQFFILYFLIFCNEIWSQGSQKCYFHVLSWFYIWSSTFISNMKSLLLFGFSFC